MLKLRKLVDFETAQYHGFTLKEGFWYGVNTETGNPIATSTWECNGCVSIYELQDGKWDYDWYNIEVTEFQLENIPLPNTKGKLPFHRWLKEEQGIEWEDWTTNYCGTMAEQIEEEYDYYYYELPQFVQKYLQK